MVMIVRRRIREAAVFDFDWREGLAYYHWAVAAPPRGLRLDIETRIVDGIGVMIGTSCWPFRNVNYAVDYWNDGAGMKTCADWMGCVNVVADDDDYCCCCWNDDNYHDHCACHDGNHDSSHSIDLLRLHYFAHDPATVVDPGRANSVRD